MLAYRLLRQTLSTNRLSFTSLDKQQNIWQLIEIFDSGGTLTVTNWTEIKVKEKDKNLLQKERVLLDKRLEVVKEQKPHNGTYRIQEMQIDKYSTFSPINDCQGVTYGQEYEAKSMHSLSFSKGKLIS